MAKDFQAYWSETVAKNPGLADESLKLTITVESLKRQIERAYKRGNDDAASFYRGLNKIRGATGGMFDGMFDTDRYG